MTECIVVIAVVLTRYALDYDGPTCENNRRKRGVLFMPQREEIMQQALGLPPEDRAFVAAALEHSLAAESTGPIPGSADPGGRAILEGAELSAELQRRSAGLRAGLTTARPATEVLADLLRRQAAESPT